VLNAKHHGVPQNRERVFIVGIRDDQDNSFQFPKEEHLTKRLKDVLEWDVDDKYFLSENTINSIMKSNFEDCKPMDFSREDYRKEDSIEVILLGFFLWPLIVFVGVFSILFRLVELCLPFSRNDFK
jgi:site-specific DNA-cytosine methylase